MNHPAAELLADLKKAVIPNTMIHDVRKVRELAQLAGKLTRTAMPDGKPVRMQPMAVDVAGARTELEFPHKYGADTRAVLAEAGFAGGEIAALVDAGVIHGPPAPAPGGSVE